MSERVSPKRDYVLVTSFGTDRPGIVEELTAWILESGGNVEESRMARLRSEFAALVLVSGPPGLFDKLTVSQAQFEAQSGQSLVLKRIEETAPPSATPALRYRLDATSLDHPGIVNRLAHILRGYGVNIVTATTHVEPAPFTSAPVFRVQMELEIPATASIAQLRAELATSAAADGIDVMLVPS
jgi:glycine cleavage system transcriptional repressor